MTRWTLIPSVVLSIGLGLTVASCAMLKRSADSVVRTLGFAQHVEFKAPPPDAPPEYRAAIASLEASKWSEALQKLDAFISGNPASPWSQAALLNSGRALEGLERWTDAAERYRAVVQATNEARKLQAMALYRLSVCQEALGDDQQVVAVLSDVLARASELPEETAAAEVPARLASAYARVGNFDRAQEFYRQAESGIARLRQEAGDSVPSWLPRTLFDMGAMSRHKPQWQEFEMSLRPLARGQVYLMQAAELEVAPWSGRAADELISTYAALWNVIASAQPDSVESDPLLATRVLQTRQWERAILLLDSLAELRARALPKDAARLSASAKKILKAGDDLERQISLLLLERPAGEGLTREALARRQALRGHTVTSSDELERRFIEGSREVKPLEKIRLNRVKTLPKKTVQTKTIEAPPAATPAPVAPPVQVPAAKPPVEDPNL